MPIVKQYVESQREALSPRPECRRFRAKIGEIGHPTQKPVEALTPLVETFSKPGDLVLDPFCGSGSSLVAAHDLGRDFLGIELSREHHRTASERLASTGRAAA